MLCPNCGQELSDQETICPGCGQELQTEPQAEPAPESVEEPVQEQSAAEEPIEESAEEPAEDSQAESESAEESTEESPEDQAAEAGEAAPAAEQKKKKSPVAIVLGAIVGVLLIVVVCMAVMLTTLSKTGEMPGFVTSITDWFEQVRYDGDAVALTLQDQDGNTVDELTNEQISYYYWGEYYYFVQNSGFPLDAAQPLDQQSYSEDQTWQDYFLDCASTSALQVLSLKAEAEKAGFEMPEEYQTEYDSTIASMADYALQAGFTDKDGNGDVLAYVRDSYGPGATMETFSEYLYDSYYITAYSDQLYADLSYTDEDLENYYDENSEMFASYGVEKSEKPNINVRHILIAPEADEEGNSSDEAKADAKTEAERILEEWKSGEATEESFGELANEYSTDPGSNTNGGLYQDVAPGQMVTEFNDWCFDDARKTGDTGIVETSYGYHIMYYVGATENYYWKTTAESELRYRDYNDIISGITGQYTTSLSKKLSLPDPDAIKAIQADAKSQADAADAAGTPAPVDTTEPDNASAAEDSAVG